MKAFAFLLPLMTCGVIHAQSQHAMSYEPALLCPQGYNPASVCADSKPSKDQCTCTCGDGLVYHEPHPGNGHGHYGPHPIDDDPCTAGDLKPWTYLTFYRKANTHENSKIAWGNVDIDEDGILVVSDHSNRCEHMEIFVNGTNIGDTHGSGKLDNGACGGVEDCLRKNGGQHGYYTLPKEMAPNVEEAVTPQIPDYQQSI
ncbi:hypothetical protein DDE82_003243 [Stemphylium lycopersici]|uniref:Uncharacterized protein n=1 Tax=Stemphylium lycopersici TaxID=183478 RepID=A0A364N4A5_STELY|nr:hypothetical protein DDE82_003243 [Stemphylium lycopersici]RAR11422.1 hypothetical protein DDE83_004568 [Stemphylium lycopersici]